MKPLNSSSESCVHTTSNCVIWQGPDIPCLDLCKGDTISDVVYKLATEFCEITDSLKVDAYDLSCFNLVSCQPEDFQALIQFLINRVCALEECTDCQIGCDTENVNPSGARTAGGTTTTTTGCPDCIVGIAECFYYKNEIGDTVTSMQLSDYVRAIGIKVCSIADTIALMQSTLADHETRIAALEAVSYTPYTTPQITPQYVLPSVLTDIDTVLVAVEEQFGELRNATGTPSEIYVDIAKQPAGLAGETPLDGSGGTMGAKTGWNNPVQNFADAIGNIWITIQDMRNAIRDIQLNCCPSGCDGVELSMTAEVNADLLTVYVDGTVPSNFVECNGITSVEVTDSNGNKVTFTYSLLTYLNNPTGFTFNLTGTPVDSSLNLTIKIVACVEDPSTGTTCERCLGYHIINEAPCPDVVYETTGETVSYSFTSAVGSYDYKVELWDAAGGALISSQIQSITGVQTVTGQFIGLSPNTTYKVRVVITPTACPECTPIECPFTNVTTSPEACPPPAGASAEIDYV